MTCGIYCNLSLHLWCKGLFWGAADSWTKELSFHGLALSHHVGVEAPEYWLLSVRTGVLHWQEATSHIFLQVWKLEPSQTHEEHFLWRPSDVLEVVAVWEKKSSWSQRSYPKSPSRPHPPMLRPWEMSLNPFTCQSSHQEWPLLLTDWYANTKIIYVWDFGELKPWPSVVYLCELLF